MSLCDKCPTQKQVACLKCAECGVTVACENYGEMLLRRDDITKSTSDVITDGLKHDGGKPRLSLVPPILIKAVGTVMTHGAEKYGVNSYKKVAPERYRDALARHYCEYMEDPYGVDKDSGLPHLYHLACNVAFLLYLERNKNKEK